MARFRLGLCKGGWTRPRCAERGLRSNPGRARPAHLHCGTHHQGKGVSFMENTVLWHYRTARGEEFEAALRELEDSA